LNLFSRSINDDDKKFYRMAAISHKKKFKFEETDSKEIVTQKMRKNGQICSATFQSYKKKIKEGEHLKTFCKVKFKIDEYYQITNLILSLKIIKFNLSYLFLCTNDAN
jgi:hypothetical protein